MGCFNMTCSVSHLPITDGMAMRAFIVGRPEQPSDYTFYPSAFFVPLSTGVKGSYDDYGRIQNCAPAPGFELAREHYFPKVADQEAFYDSATREKTEFPYFDETVKCDASLAFVREDIYQAVMEMGLAPERDGVEKELVDLKGRIARERQKWGGDFVDKWGPLSGDYDYRGRFAQLFRGAEGDLTTDAFQPYRDELVRRLAASPDIKPATVDLAMEIAEFLHFNRQLHDLCIAWQPTTNMVGQERPYDIQRDFAKAVQRICADELKEEARQEAQWNKPAKPAAKKKPQAKPKKASLKKPAA